MDQQTAATLLLVAQYDLEQEFDGDYKMVLASEHIIEEMKRCLGILPVVYRGQS